MEKYLDFLGGTEWFGCIPPEERKTLLQCLAVKERSYRIGEYLFRTTDYISDIGLITQGRIHMISEDAWGKKFILTEYGKGDVFGEAHSLTPDEPLLFDIVAVEPTDVLYFDASRVMNHCAHACDAHQALVRSLARIIARKKVYFLHKIEHLSRKTLREKIGSYLSEQAKKSGSQAFAIPYSRQGMADYLGVDRSALSAELGRMQRDGLLEYERNHFVLKRGLGQP